MSKNYKHLRVKLALVACIHVIGWFLKILFKKSIKCLGKSFNKISMFINSLFAVAWIKVELMNTIFSSFLHPQSTALC